MLTIIKAEASIHTELPLTSAIITVRPIPISHENFVGSCLCIHIFLFQLKVQHLDKRFKGHWNHLKANLRSGKMCGGWAEDRAALFFLVPKKVTFGGIWCCHPLTDLIWSHGHVTAAGTGAQYINVLSVRLTLILLTSLHHQHVSSLQDKVVLWQWRCSCPVVTKTQGFIPTNESWARAWVAAVTSSFSPSAPSAPKSIHAGQVIFPLSSVTWIVSQ